MVVEVDGTRCEQGGEETEMTGKDRRCSVRDLEPDTEYAVCVRCCAEDGGTMWR